MTANASGRDRLRQFLAGMSRITFVNAINGRCMLTPTNMKRSLISAGQSARPVAGLAIRAPLPPEPRAPRLERRPAAALARFPRRRRRFLWVSSEYLELPTGSKHDYCQVPGTQTICFQQPAPNGSQPICTSTQPEFAYLPPTDRVTPCGRTCGLP
jgi:hypothetical protein